MLTYRNFLIRSMKNIIDVIINIEVPPENNTRRSQRVLLFLEEINKVNRNNRLYKGKIVLPYNDHFYYEYKRQVAEYSFSSEQSPSSVKQ